MFFEYEEQMMCDSNNNKLMVSAIRAGSAGKSSYHSAKSQAPKDSHIDGFGKCSTVLYVGSTTSVSETTSKIIRYLKHPSQLRRKAQANTKNTSGDTRNAENKTEESVLAKWKVADEAKVSLKVAKRHKHIDGSE